MRQATSLKIQRGAQTSGSLPIPAPIGGLNTRDPPALVPITEATTMSGMFPAATGVLVRKGWSPHATSLPASTESLMVYTNSSGAEAMFAASGTAFYNVTAAGAVGGAVVSGLSNARWQSVNFSISGGTSYLCCFNGVDAPRYWDGATWTAITGISTPAITGVTTTTIISAAIHQRRMWLIPATTLKAWYLPIDSVGGAAAALDLGGIATKGGYIMAAETLTLDGGDGLDDLLVFITSQGQLIAFTGTDPSSAATWQHAGTWDISPPQGVRSLYQYKGDVLIITTAGIASTARVIAGDTTNSGMITDKISATYQQMYSVYGSRFGWQLLFYAKLSMLIFSVNGTLFAMNSVTGAWSGQMNQLAPLCFALLGGEPYFGDATVATGVRKFWASDTDNGTAITGSFLSGYSDLGAPGVMKQPSLARFAINSEGGAVTVTYNTRADFLNGSATPQNSVTLASQTTLTPWLSVTNGGVAISLFVQLTAAGGSSYSGAFLVFQQGGILGIPRGA